MPSLTSTRPLAYFSFKSEQHINIDEKRGEGNEKFEDLVYWGGKITICSPYGFGLFAVPSSLIKNKHVEIPWMAVVRKRLEFYLQPHMLAAV